MLDMLDKVIHNDTIINFNPSKFMIVFLNN